MIPSRGLRWSAQNISIGRRRLELFTARSFSSTPTPNGASQLSQLVSLVSKTGVWNRRNAPLRLGVCRAASAMRNGGFIRFQSTSPGVSSTEEILSSNIDRSTWAQDSSSLGPLDKAIDLTSTDLSNIPEQVGYLKAMGLDYGYGPTSMMEWILEHVHIIAGTPWWASIALTALVVRLACLYPNIIGTDNAAKMAIVAPFAKPLLEKMKESSKLGDNAEAMKIRAELMMINKRAGVKYWKAILPMIQAPIGFGTFFLLRGMASLPVPGFETGGLLWFYNLTIPDPFFILPLCTAGILHFVLRKGGETGVQNMSPDFLRAMSYFLPTMSLMVTAFLPSAIQLSFLVTSALSFCQAQLFRWAPFRTYMKMTPLPTNRPDAFAPAPAPEPSPYQSRIITVSARAASSASSTNYEPPRSSGDSSSAESTLLSGLKREVSMGISSVQESARKTMRSAREMAGQEPSKDGKRTKRQLQQANEYEKRRRLEETRKREERDRVRRARRGQNRFSD